MTERSVEVPGGRLHVVDEGARTDPAILLLHAGIADSRAWDDLAPLLVEAGYRVIRRDMRGFGRTQTEDVEYSNRADIVAVLDAVGVGRAVLVGNSAGGQTAFDTAIEFPERVAAVVGVASGLGGFEGEPTAEELELFERGDTLETAYFDAPTVEAAETLIEFEVAFWVDGPDQPTDRVPSSIRDAVRDMELLHYTPGRAQGRPIPLRPPANDRVAELRCPVLAVAGSLDVSHMTQAALRLEAAIPTARAVILRDVAHMIGMEAPDRLADLIIEFLAPLPRWS